MPSRNGGDGSAAGSRRSRQRGLWRGAILPALVAGLLALLGGPLLAACGGSGQPEIVDESGLEWQARGQACVRQTEEGPVRRAINRVDPELCGRTVKVRSRDYVRVIPPPGMRSR